MFSVKEDKNNLREATLTAIQGFPPDVENNNIITILTKKQKQNSLRNSLE